jgi:hypothetical protein
VTEDAVTTAVEQSQRSKTFRSAVAYWRAGFSVIPIRRDGTKAPSEAWKQYQERRPGLDDLRRWFDRDDPPGVAIVAGGVSRNAELLDFDDGRLFRPWKRLVNRRRPGLIEKLSVVRTPREGGGYHVWQRCTAAIPGNDKLARRPATEGELKHDPETRVRTTIETRGQGGYALVPGSPPECHVSGQEYRHVAGPELSRLAPITPEEREILIDCSRAFNRLVDPKPDPRPPRERQDGDVLPGDDYNRRGPPIEELLGECQWTVAYSRGDVCYVGRPGKREGSVSATVGYCRDGGGNPLLWVFSSNAHPFESNRCYSRFAVYAFLHHDGDFSQAAKALAAHGYGSTSRGNTMTSDSTASTGFTESLEWERPTPLIDAPPVEPFPVDVLPRHSADFADSVATSMGGPVDFVAAPMVALAGGRVGARRRLRVNPTWAERPITYLLTVGPSGSIKSPMLMAAAAPLFDAQHRRFEAWQRSAGGDQSGSATLERFVVGDATVEVLNDVLRDNPRGVVQVRDEASALMASFGQYKSGRGADRQWYLERADGATIVNDRRNQDGRPTIVHDPHLSFVGTIQPAVLRGLFERNEDGFWNRFLYAFPPPTPVPGYIAFAAPENRLAGWADTLDKLARLPCDDDRGRAVGFTPDGLAAWGEFLNGHAEESNDWAFPEHLRGAWSKLRGQCARLALILHLLRHVEGEVGCEDVDAESMRRAVRLVGYFKSHGRKVHDEGAADPRVNGARKVLTWLQKTGKSRFTRRDAHTALSGTFKKADQLDGPLSLLVEHHWLRPDPQADRPGPGRKPSPAYEVNPALHREISTMSRMPVAA